MTVLDDQSATRSWHKIGWDGDHPPSFLPHPRALHRQRVLEAQILASTIMAFLYSLVKVIYPFFVILAAVLLYNYGPEHSLTTLISPVTHHTPTSPYAASWRSWFHPLQSHLGYAPTALKRYWNVLHHLGGNGPWVEMLDEGSRTPDLAPPPGCSMDQVHMVRNLNTFNGKGESLLMSYRCRGTQRDTLRRLLAIVSFISLRQADLSSR